MTTKKCFKCNIEWPLIFFYKHKEMSDGHLNKCKKCARNDTKKNTEKNIDYYREYERKRALMPERIKYNYQNTKKWREKFPEKYKAQNKVNNYLRDNKILKQPCCVCGNKKSHAHHEDYKKPLDVIWVCALHHRDIE